MADEADLGNDTADQTLQSYINRVRAQAEYSLVPCGHCYNCDELVQGARLFCDGFCRDDYDLRKRRRG